MLRFHNDEQLRETRRMANTVARRASDIERLAHDRSIQTTAAKFRQLSDLCLAQAIAMETFCAQADVGELPKSDPK